MCVLLRVATRYGRRRQQQQRRLQLVGQVRQATSGDTHTQARLCIQEPRAPRGYECERARRALTRRTFVCRRAQRSNGLMERERARARRNGRRLVHKIKACGIGEQMSDEGVLSRVSFNRNKYRTHTRVNVKHVCRFLGVTTKLILTKRLLNFFFLSPPARRDVSKEILIKNKIKIKRVLWRLGDFSTS